MEFFVLENITFKELLSLLAVIGSLISILIAERARYIAKLSYQLNLKPNVFVEFNPPFEKGDLNLEIYNEGPLDIHEVMIYKTIRVVDNQTGQNVIFHIPKRSKRSKAWRKLRKLKSHKSETFRISQTGFQKTFNMKKFAVSTEEVFSQNYKDDSYKSEYYIPMQMYTIRYRIKPSNLEHEIRKYLAVNESKPGEFFGYDASAIMTRNGADFIELIDNINEEPENL